MSTRRRTIGGKIRDWSELPDDLLLLISNRLDPRFDRPRIRAVCTSWRSCIPFMLPTNNSFRIPIVQPLCTDLTVEESTVYRIKYKYDDPKSKSRGGEFLMTVEERDYGKLFLVFNPKGDRCENIRKGLNLLDCCITEFQKYHTVELAPYSTSKAAYSIEHSALLFMSYKEGLQFIRVGEDKLTQIGDAFDYHSYYADITLYNGSFYAIDRNGKVTVLDPLTMSITLTANLPKNNGCAQKFFARSQDHLYMIGKEPSRGDFKIYKLNGSVCALVSVKRMRDQVVFVSPNFSFIAPLAGISGNQIIFEDHHFHNKNTIFFQRTRLSTLV